MTWEIREGDVLDRLREMPDESVHCVVTSPPYWGLRDYGVAGQIGLEPTPAAYLARMVEVFREVRRVLRSDGTCWVNMGDSYSSGTRKTQVAPTLRTKGHDDASGKHAHLNGFAVRPGAVEGIAGKQLLGIPWRLAFALQDDGWWLRSEIIWAKPNPMPESVTDRPTKAHEQIFLLTKSARYWYDADAIREPLIKGAAGSTFTDGKTGVNGLGRVSTMDRDDNPAGRNARSVWTIATQPFRGAHFATFPQRLAERCILAGSPVGGVVLDPFAGSGTTVMVAVRLGRNGVGIELNADYCVMARARVASATPGTAGQMSLFGGEGGLP